MANVLKYLTGALSKRAKRRGNLAVGIGEENYGPSSTTGYYNGITPPDGGFVVYATGSNSTPKVFVANSEDDLPAIARTLGGGILDVLGAKNYIAGLTHAWIINSIPNNTITDGLILDLNAKNPSSFLDNEPTDNLFGTTAMEFKDDAGIYTNDIISGTDSIGDYFIKDVNNAPWWSGLRIYNNNVRPLTAGVSYVLSFECRSGQTGWSWAYDSNASGGGWSGNDQGRLSNTNLTFDSTGGTVYTSDMANTWQRVSYRVTMKDSSVFTGATAYPHDSFFTNTNNVQIYYRNPQLEVGRTEATDYSSGVRSQNTTWKDLSGNGNNAILQNGVGFDQGKKTLVLDNSDDRIRSLINYYDLVTGSFTIMISGKKTAYGSSGNNVGNSTLFQGAGNGWNGGWRIVETNTGTPGNSFSGRHNIQFSSPGTGGSSTNKSVTDPIDAHRPFFYAFSLSGSTGTAFLNSNTSIGSHNYGGGVQTSQGYISYTSAGVGAWGGDIYNMKVYNKGLSLEEINQNYYGGPIVTDGLVFAVDAGNLVSYESGSTTTYSMTGSYSGSLNNGVAYTDSYGGGFDFDGSNDYITCDDSTKTGLNFGTGDFTLEAWFRPIDNSNSWTGVMVKGGSGGPGYAMTYRAVGSGIDLKMDIDAPDNKHYQSGYLTSGEVYHIVMVYDRDTAGFVYNNGELTHTHTDLANQNQSVDNSSFPLRLGTYDGGQWFMEGNIYAARVYDRALSSDEVLQNYNAQKARFGK